MSISSLKSLVAGLALAAAGIAPTSGQAATATTSFAVTLTVLNECIVAATPMAFGSLSLVSPTGGTATSTLTVTCTAQTPYTIGLNAGTAPGATIQTRILRGPGTSTVPYTLYQDAARTVLWGNTVGTVVTVAAATGLPQLFTVYGQILGGQAAALPGVYTDTIGVTVTY